MVETIRRICLVIAELLNMGLLIYLIHLNNYEELPEDSLSHPIGVYVPIIVLLLLIGILVSYFHYREDKIRQLIEDQDLKV